MSTTTDAATGPTGLPQGRPPAADDSERRSGEELINQAARGGSLAPREKDDLLAYFLSNDSLPGDLECLAVTVELGHGKQARQFAAEIHPIEWSEWQDARERATKESDGTFDPYVSASWIVARALVAPKLGPTVARLQEEARQAEAEGGKGDAPTDAAHLLRRMFAKQSGALLELSGKVLEISKLQNENASVKEVEAGKP